MLLSYVETSSWVGVHFITQPCEHNNRNYAEIYLMSKLNPLYLELLCVCNQQAYANCGSPPGVMMADTLSFNAKIGVVDF